MPQTNAERQRAWRERHRGEPRGNKAMMMQLALLHARVARLEAELAAVPPAGSRAPSGRLREAYLAVRAGTKPTGRTPPADRGLRAGLRGQSGGMGGIG